MAKDKQVEAEYKANCLRRTKVRKAKRRLMRAVNRERYDKRRRCCGQRLGCDNDDWRYY